MLPKRRNPPTKDICCVCCQALTIGQDEALFCSGKCQQWIHRYCASINVACYKDKNDASFLCFCCDEGKSQCEIVMLRSTVKLLQQEISKLTESLPAAHLKDLHQEKVSHSVAMLQLHTMVSQLLMHPMLLAVVPTLNLRQQQQSSHNITMIESTML